LIFNPSKQHCYDGTIVIIECTQDIYFYLFFITFSTIGFGDFVAFDAKEANIFADYLVVFIGVVLGLSSDRRHLFCFCSVL